MNWIIQLAKIFINKLYLYGKLNLKIYFYYQQNLAARNKINLLLGNMINRKKDGKITNYVIWRFI